MIFIKRNMDILHAEQYLFILFQENVESNVDIEEPSVLTAAVTLQGHMTAITCLSFSPNALMLTTGCTRGWVNIWSLSVSYSE